MIESIKSICQYKKDNPKIKGIAIKTNDPSLDKVKSDLINLKEELSTTFSNFKGHTFTVKISSGATNFPNVLHACILPLNQKVSDGIYTAICFDIDGKGIVVGCAESKSNPKGLNIKIRSSKTLKPKINVDGSGTNTKYNNTFENPKEFFTETINEEDLKNQIYKSLELSLYNLKQNTETEYLQASELLNSSINEQELEYKKIIDIIDDRKKTATLINLRRGQRKFRKTILEIYNFKCAISECTIVDLLEAAHIFPYKGVDTNVCHNGILLRSDFHTIFDLGLITINPKTYTIELSEALINDSYYNQFNGKKIALPKDPSHKPFKEYLEHHFNNIFNK